MREYQVGSQSAVHEGFCLRLIRNSPPRSTSKTKQFKLKQTQSRSIREQQMSVFEFYELSAWPLYITTVSYVIDPLQTNICSVLPSTSVKPKAAFLRTKQLSLQFPYDYMSQEDEAFSTSSERVTTQLNILFHVLIHK